MKERMISAQILDDWCLQYKPSRLTILNLKTGQQLQEPSLVAAKYRLEERTGTNRATGETRTFSFKVLERYLAVGEEARAYENTPDVMVFSPFRDGQVAQYGGAEYLFRELIRRVSPKIRPSRITPSGQYTTSSSRLWRAKASTSPSSTSTIKSFLPLMAFPNTL